MKRYDVTFRYVVPTVATSEEDAKQLACEILAQDFNESNYHEYIFDVKEGSGNPFDPYKYPDDLDMLYRVANRLGHEGWVLVDDDGCESLRLQRIDDAEIFNTDIEAVEFVINKAMENLDGLHSEVLKFVFGMSDDDRKNMISGVAGWVRIKKLIDHWKI